MGDGGLDPRDTESRQAPASDTAGPVIVPGMPGAHWWKRPLYETPEWWRKRAWIPRPDRIAACIIGLTVGTIIVMVIYTDTEPAIVKAPTEKIVNDDCSKFGWLRCDEHGEWRSVDEQDLRSCLLPKDPCGYRSGSTRAHAVSESGPGSFAFPSPQFTDEFIAELEALEAQGGSDQERIEAFLKQWEAQGKPNPFRPFDGSRYEHIFNLDQILDTPFGIVPTVEAQTVDPE